MKLSHRALALLIALAILDFGITLVLTQVVFRPAPAQQPVTVTLNSWLAGNAGADYSATVTALGAWDDCLKTAVAYTQCDAQATQVSTDAATASAYPPPVDGALYRSAMTDLSTSALEFTAGNYQVAVAGLQSTLSDFTALSNALGGKS